MQETYEKVNKRRYTRVPFLRRAVIEVGRMEYEVQCLDISLRGILLTRPPGVVWRLEQAVNIRIMLSIRESIYMMCVVSHIDDDVMGCACDSMDLESMVILRKVLEYNLPESTSFNRELAELIRSGNK